MKTTKYVREKIIGMFLCLCMVFSICVPIPASAAAKDWAGYDCVAYARARFAEYWGFELHWPNGNAKGYYYNAASFGDTVSNIPKVGALVVWDGITYGHVAFVEQVSGNDIYISEGGYLGRYNERWINLSNMNLNGGSDGTQSFLGFIYVKGTGSPAPAQDPWLEVWDVTDITETDATLNAYIQNPGGVYISTIGASVWDAGGNLIKNYTEPIGSGFETKSVRIYFKMNEEVGLTLTKGTKYTYQIFIVNSGGTTYYSDKYGFTTAGSHTVTFHPEGGSCDITQKNLVSGDVYGDLPTPQRAGYTFDGWYIGNKKITADTVFLVNQGTDLYAHWTKTTLSSGDFEYELDENGRAHITGYTGTDAVVTVPALIDGYTVSEIGMGAFIANEFLTEVILPNGLETIEFVAFAECPALKYIQIPASLIDIGVSAFSGCTSLEEFAIPPNAALKSIDYLAFYGCTNLSAIHVGEGSPYYYDIDGVLLDRKGNLWIYPEGKTDQTYTVPEDVTAISGRIWSEHLESVTIPDSVHRILGEAFKGSKSLTTIYGFEGSCAEDYAAQHGIAFIAYRKLTDSATQIQISDTVPGLIPADAVLSVRQTAKDTLSVQYDLALLQNGAVVEPAGEIAVTFPVPEGLDGEKCTVLLQGSGGDVAVQTEVKNGQLVCVTDRLGLFTIAETATAPGDSVLAGDVDTDGQITINDVMAACRILARQSGREELTADEIVRVDLNGDERIDILDIMCICRILASKSV